MSYENKSATDLIRWQVSDVNFKFMQAINSCFIMDVFLGTILAQVSHYNLFSFALNFC